MSEKETKLEVKIEDQEMPTFLRELADFLEGKNISSFFFPENLTSIEKLKIKIERNKTGSFSAKWKTNAPKTTKEDGIFLPLTEEDDSSQLSYKQLKKRMKKTYKEIKNQIETDVVPSSVIVAQFIEDSETMMTFDDDEYGPKFYDAYRDGMTLFNKAFDQKSLPQMRTAIDDLDNIVSACHDKYK